MEREKVQCSSGHWERCLGKFLNEVAGSCTHFAEFIEGAIKVGTGKILYSVVIFPGQSKIEENWFPELITSSSNKQTNSLTGIVLGPEFPKIYKTFSLPVKGP